jgi:hypothetical protein
MSDQAEAATADATPPDAAPAAKASLWQRMARGLALLLGTWTAPPWLQWLGRILARAVGTMRARPGNTLAAVAVLALLGAGGYYGHAWWRAQPKPVEVSFKVDSPALTDFANEGQANPLVVTFSQSVAPLEGVGKPVETGLAVSPPVEGTWTWAGDQQLQFKPKAEWPVGAQYKVVIARSAVAPQITLDRYDFEFASAAFVPTVRKAEFHQDPINPALKKAVFEIGFTHPVNSAEFERRIELRLAGQADGVLGVGRETTRFTVAYDKLHLNAYVHSVALPIPKEATNLNLTLDKGVLAQAGGVPSQQALTAAVQVPGLYSLQVADAAVAVVTNERYEPEQVLTLTSSQLVHEREVAKAVTAWLLPLQNPRLKKEEQTEEPYPWADPAEVSEAVLKQATRLDLAPVPAEQEHTQTHAFKMRADVGRAIFLRVDPKLKSFGGYLMREAAPFIITVPPYPAELRILSQGALLAMSGEKKIAVLVRDLPGLRVELARVQPAQLQHLVSQSQGNFSNPDFMGSFGPDNLADRFETKIPLPGLERGKPHYEAIDLAPYLARTGDLKRGLFLLKVQGYDPQAEAAAVRQQAQPDPNAPAQAEPGEEESQNTEGEGEGQGEGIDPSSKEERRLVLVTDLGLLAKQSTDGSRDVFVQSILSGEPVAGVTVDVVAKNGSTLFSQTTDAAGHVHFDKLEGLVRERAHCCVLARGRRHELCR